jgi:hypothetical protein
MNKVCGCGRWGSYLGSTTPRICFSAARIFSGWSGAPEALPSRLFAQNFHLLLLHPELVDIGFGDDYAGKSGVSS